MVLTLRTQPTPLRPLSTAFPDQLTVFPVALVAGRDQEVTCTAHNVSPARRDDQNTVSFSLLLGDRELEGAQAQDPELEEESQDGEDSLFQVTQRWLLPLLGTSPPPALQCQATLRLPGLERSHRQPIPGECGPADPHLGDPQGASEVAPPSSSASMSGALRWDPGSPLTCCVPIRMVTLPMVAGEIAGSCPGAFALPCPAPRMPFPRISLWLPHSPPSGHLPSEASPDPPALPLTHAHVYAHTRAHTHKPFLLSCSCFRHLLSTPDILYTLLISFRYLSCLRSASPGCGCVCLVLGCVWG